jgi:ABC-type branched-subunit amino acid transport system ATPase component
MDTGNNILKVESLLVGYDKTIVLQDVSFKLNQQEILVLIGQNGTGKSTLLKTLCGLVPFLSGSIFFSGNKLSNLQPHKLINLGISYFAQGGLIMPSLTIEEHLQLASLAKKKAPIFEEIYDSFSKLFDLRKTKAGNLSGGERQMLSFGILMTHESSLWLLDEPTAGLAPSVVEFTVEFLKQKNKENNITMLIVEHNIGVAVKLATHIAIAKGGTLTAKFSQQDFKDSDFVNNLVYN